MTTNTQRLASKIDTIMDEAYKVALADRHLTCEDVRNLAMLYDAKNMLKKIHKEMLEEEAEHDAKKAEMCKKMEHNDHVTKTAMPMAR